MGPKSYFPHHISLNRFKTKMLAIAMRQNNGSAFVIGTCEIRSYLAASYWEYFVLCAEVSRDAACV